MNKIISLPMIIALALVCSCQKSETEEERNAEVERRVQKRLEAEHQAQQHAELEEREPDLDAREKELAEKEQAAVRARDLQAPRPPAPRQDEPAGPGRPQASYSTFYTRLEPQGIWRETGDYGYVWQPYEAQRSPAWRPYTIGRWAYTDLGWMWISEEPFGWAAYHYGRWARLRGIGWVWIPGDEWAPAWVSWRKSNEFVGWAPLPPEARFDRRTGIRNWADNYYDIGPDYYCFVPTQQFGAQRVAPTVVSPERNVAIVNQTINVTNITYKNTSIVNYGPDYYELRTRTQQPIENLRVERRTTLEADTPHAVVRGETVEVPAPIIVRMEKPQRPQRIKEKVARVTVERGWDGIPDKQAAARARAKIRAESTPPPDAPPKTFVRPGAPAETPAVTSAATTVELPVASPRESPRLIRAPRRTPPSTKAAAESPAGAPSAVTAPSPVAEPSSTRAETPRERPIPSRPRPTPTPPPVESPGPPPETLPRITPTLAVPASADAPTLSGSPRMIHVPRFSGKGEKKGYERRSIARELEPRETVPVQTPTSATFPEPSMPEAASSDSTNSNAKPKGSKEIKKEKNREKSERRRGTEIEETAFPSPTPP